MISSVFSVSMAALQGRQSPRVSSVITQEALQAFGVTRQLFRDIKDSSPSLQMMRGILAERVPDMNASGSP
jgi:hypothetical protein